MRANSTPRPSGGGRSLRLRLVVALLAAGSLPACTGDNLFTGLVLGGGLFGPEVQITAPQQNFTMAVGDSVQVTANLSSPEGITSVTFSGLFSGGSTAFNQIVIGALPAPQDTTISRYMRQSGAVTGIVRVIVEATDALGERGADTVTVSIQ